LWLECIRRSRPPHQLDAAILRPALLGGVVRGRLGVAEAGGVSRAVSIPCATSQAFTASARSADSF